ncbi:MAG: toll/interleukin-1 receptor domain-containing protein [Geminicoccaceae bacterium]
MSTAITAEMPTSGDAASVVGSRSSAFQRSGQIRLFISHRASHGVEALALAVALEGYGISGFVAHQSIEPTMDWQLEITKALNEMDVLLALITSNFHAGAWTDQEVGFALGRKIPILALSINESRPSGFLASRQVLHLNKDSIDEIVPDLYKIVAAMVNDKHRLQDALIDAFVRSANWSETKVRFERLDSVVENLSIEQVNTIVNGFKENDQLYRADYLTIRHCRLQRFLRRVTGKNYVIGKNIIEFHN